MLVRVISLVLGLLISATFAQNTTFSGATVAAVKRHTCEEPSANVIFRTTVIYPEIIVALLQENALSASEQRALTSLLERVEREDTVIVAFQINLRTSVEARDRVVVELPGYAATPARYRFALSPEEIYEPVRAYALPTDESQTLSLSATSTSSPLFMLNFGTHPEAFTVGAAYLFGPFAIKTYLQGQSTPTELRDEMRCLYSFEDGILGNAAGGIARVLPQSYLKELLSNLVQID